MQTRWWREGLGEENYQAFIDRYAQSAPLKTAGTTGAVADPVVWLLEGAEHVTGETILVDAGSHLGPAPPRYSPGCSELCPGTDGPVIPRANPRLTEVRRRV